MALNNDLLEKWYVDTIKMKHAFAGTTPPSPVPLPSVTDNNGLLEGIAEETGNAVIEAAIYKGYEHNTVETAYNFILPDKLYKWIGVKNIGGNTVVNNSALVNAEVAKVISKDGSNNVLQTYDVPAVVQALTGYGWGARNVYNEVDFVNKKYIQRVGIMNLGALTWTYSSGDHARFRSEFMPQVKPVADSAVGNVICPIYETVRNNDVYNHLKNKIISVGNSGSDGFFAVYDSSYTDASTFKEAMGGVFVHYEMATPVETDISAYITDDVITEVTAGGTITFENEHMIPVPVFVDYVGR